MSEDTPRQSRRTVLHGVSGTVLGSLLAGTGTASAGSSSAQPAADGVEYEQLKGTTRNPIAARRIEALQQRFTERIHDTTSSSAAFLDVTSTFDDESIVGYNIILGADGKPREQFVAVGSDETRPGDREVAPTVTQRRHRKADSLLERALSEENQASETQASTDANWDIDWHEWYRQGSTDVYWEPAEKWSYDAKVGNVEFTHDVRESVEYDRIGAKSKIRMEPGRQLCNDGLDEYCTSSIQTGFKNKEATVHHDWDQWVNDVPQNDLIVNTDPEGQISDVTGTRGYSLGLEIAKEPSLSIGFNSSVSFPGAQLIDKTSKTTGRAEFGFELNSPSSPSAGNNAVFTVGSVAEYEKRCTTAPPLYQRNLLEIDVDLEWGLDAPLIAWGHTESTTKSFQYTTWC